MIKQFEIPKDTIETPEGAITEIARLIADGCTGGILDEEIDRIDDCRDKLVEGSDEYEELSDQRFDLDCDANDLRYFLDNVAR